MTVRLFIDLPEPARVRAAYALDVLFEGIGVAVQHVTQDADVVYSTQKPQGDALWLQASHGTDWDDLTIEVVQFEGMPLIVPKGDTARDVVRSAYAYLTGIPERSAPRDWAGRPVSDSNFRDFGLHRTPVVSRYASWLEDQLPPRLLADRVARWPKGKRCAVVLSHDVDGPFSKTPPAVAWQGIRGMAGQRAWGKLPRMLAGFAKISLRHRGDPRRDPNLRFRDWVDFAGSLGGRQTFYVAVRPFWERGAHPRDVGYDFRHPAILDSLREARDRGAEIGVHASINAKLSQARMTEERERLAVALGGYQVRGLRHHFWATDAELPERTSWLHAAAGFDYDSSFGLNDAPGFRRGMAWPFEPFDHERGERIPLLQIPPTMMDGGVFYRDVTPEEGTAQMRSHFADVFAHGGAAVLDWHMEQMNPARLRGAGPLLIAVLRDLAADSEVWWPSAAELCDWWRERRRALAKLHELEGETGRS